MIWPIKNVEANTKNVFWQDLHLQETYSKMILTWDPIYRLNKQTIGIFLIEN